MNQGLEHLIAIVGMPGSGKSSATKYLEEHGWKIVYFGGVTLDEVKRRGLEINETNERTVREEIRASEGMEAFAKRMLPQIEKLIEDGADKIAIDGLYSWSEYKLLQSKFGDNLSVVAITAPRATRYERLIHRPGRPLSLEQAQHRDQHEIEHQEKGGPIAYADFTIVNDSTPQDFIDSLKQVVEKIEQT